MFAFSFWCHDPVGSALVLAFSLACKKSCCNSFSLREPRAESGLSCRNEKHHHHHSNCCCCWSIWAIEASACSPFLTVQSQWEQNCIVTAALVVSFLSLVMVNVNFHKFYSDVVLNWHVYYLSLRCKTNIHTGWVENGPFFL